MGTRFEIRVRVADPGAGREAIAGAFAEIERVEALLSEWRPSSQISAVNRAAGGAAVPIGPDLYHVVERALRISSITDGAFDITFAACGGLWSFSEPRVPEAEEIADCLRHVGHARVRLDAGRAEIRLPDPGMRLGIAGIGKGYGIDRAAEVLEAHGITDYLVDGGGDIRLRGAKSDGPWRVGIAHPRRPGLLGAVRPRAGAIVTSGDYQIAFERDGERYHHIIDPRTGQPARRTIAVTVIADEATEADALATGLFVLGPERGLALVESLQGVEALFVAPDLAEHASSGFPALDRE